VKDWKGNNHLKGYQLEKLLKWVLEHEKFQANPRGTQHPGNSMSRDLDGTKHGEVSAS
jgi:hypothetical protein